MASARSSCKDLSERIPPGYPQDLLVRTCTGWCKDLLKRNLIGSQSEPFCARIYQKMPQRAAQAQVGPNPGQFCGLNATRWKLAFLRLFPTFLGFDGGSCKELPTLGMSRARLRRQMPAHRTKLRMLSPTCVQTCPSCAMLGPEFSASYAQVGANWAPARPNLRPRTAKFDLAK